MATWSKPARRWTSSVRHNKTEGDLARFPFVALPAELQLEVMMRVYDEPWIIVIDGDSHNLTTIKINTMNAIISLSVPHMRDMAIKAIAKMKLGTICVPAQIGASFWYFLRKYFEMNPLLRPFTTGASTIIFREGLPQHLSTSTLQQIFPNVRQIQLGFDTILHREIKDRYKKAIQTRKLWLELPKIALEVVDIVRTIGLEHADIPNVNFKLSYSLPTSKFASIVNEFNAKVVVLDILVKKGKSSVESIWFHTPKSFNEVGPLTTCSEKALRWARVSKVDMLIREIPDSRDVFRLES